MTTPERATPVAGTLAFYACHVCGAELTLERVRRIERQLNRLLCTYTCPCSPGQERGTLYVPSATCLRRLTGRQAIATAWTNPVQWHDELPDNLAGEVETWAWEVDQLADADELAWWLAHYSPTRERVRPVGRLRPRPVRDAIV